MAAGVLRVKIGTGDMGKLSMVTLALLLQACLDNKKTTIETEYFSIPKEKGYRFIPGNDDANSACMLILYDGQGLEMNVCGFKLIDSSQALARAAAYESSWAHNCKNISNAELGKFGRYYSKGNVAGFENEASGEVFFISKNFVATKSKYVVIFSRFVSKKIDEGIFNKMQSWSKEWTFKE